MSGAAEYDRLDANVKTLQNDMKNIRTSFKEKIDPLKNRMVELEKIILDYLEANHLPGVKLEGTMFMREEVPVYISRESKIENILKTEPPATKPDVVTRKIIDTLKKRLVTDSSPDTTHKKNYRLKVFRK